ncbi:MAG: DUF5063 domain-containing protein [Muribaculaceae bacterium]|nr:DUF5063 domain-containing protein [Muribaculaceae bacterium]
MDLTLNNNVVAFIGLANEYCNTLENCREMEREDFVTSMLKMLPRLYIMATDLKDNLIMDEQGYIADALDEDYYETVRQNAEALIGPDDVYLEVFEEDMKYSDTPVSASISEGLADIFQVLYNFIATVRDDATDDTVALAIESVREDFRNYWSRTLCNTLRALNAIAYGGNE